MSSPCRHHVICSRVGAVGGSTTSGRREFTRNNTLGRKTLCFFGCRVADGGVRASISTKKHTRLLREIDFGQSCFLLWAVNAFGRSGRQNMHQTVARARFAFQNAKELRRSEHFWKMKSAKWATWSLNHCFIDSLVHWFIASFMSLCKDMLIGWCTDSLKHWIIDGSQIHWILDSLVRWLIDSLIQWCAASLIRWFGDDWSITDPLIYGLI